MQEVKIYTGLFFKGRFDKGTADTFSVLEYVASDGELYTKVNTGKYEEITKSRAALLMVLDALKELKRECKVEMHTGEVYLTNGYTKCESQRTNKDLWKVMGEMTAKHEIIMVYEKENSYTQYMKKKMGV